MSFTKMIAQFDEDGGIVRLFTIGDLRDHHVCPQCYWWHGWHWPTCSSTSQQTCPEWCEDAPGQTHPPTADDGTVGRYP